MYINIYCIVGGAAAVLGSARATATLAPPNVEAHFIVAACEVCQITHHTYVLLCHGNLSIFLIVFNVLPNLKKKCRI